MSPRRVDRVAFPKHSRFYFGHTVRIAFRTVVKHGRCRVLSFSPTQLREGTLQGEDPSGPGRLRLKETEAPRRPVRPIVSSSVAVTCLHLCVVMAHQRGASDYRCPDWPSCTGLWSCMRQPGTEPWAPKLLRGKGRLLQWCLVLITPLA